MKAPQPILESEDVKDEGVGTNQKEKTLGVGPTGESGQAPQAQGTQAGKKPGHPQQDQIGVRLKIKSSDEEQTGKEHAMLTVLGKEIGKGEGMMMVAGVQVVDFPLIQIRNVKAKGVDESSEDKCGNDGDESESHPAPGTFGKLRKTPGKVI